MKLVCIGSSSKGNAYALVSDNEILLLEAGRPILEVKKAINWQIAKVVGCLVSHEHGDHVGRIRDYCNIGFPIYTSDETAETIAIIYGEKVTGIPEFHQIILGGFAVQPFYLPHNGTQNFGYLIEHKDMGKLLFMTDMEYCKYDFSALQVNHMLVEANYDMELVDRSIPNYNHKLMGHSSIQTTCDIIKTNRSMSLRTVTLCHLGAFSDDISFVAEAEEAAGGCVVVGVADAGRVFDVSRDPF